MFIPDSGSSQSTVAIKSKAAHLARPLQALPEGVLVQVFVHLYRGEETFLRGIIVWEGILVSWKTFLSSPLNKLTRLSTESFFLQRTCQLQV